jgi:putative peptidoglycan lipid II flippase
MSDVPTGDEVTTGGLVRSSAVVGIGTGLSRVTGLFRTIALTYALGTTLVAEGYNLANTTPNIVYDLLLGGILSATLVPLFVDRFERDDQDGVSAIVTVTVVVLTAITVIAVLAAPLIFKLYTWDKDAVRAHELEGVGVPLLRWFLPQILFYGLTALGTALLNARRRFAAPAFAPVLNNVVVIVVLLWFAHRVGRNPHADPVIHDTTNMLLLGLGTTAGIVAMTVVLWPSIRSTGVRLRWRFRPRDPAVRRVASLSRWTLGYVVANQVALTITLALAARTPGGAAPRGRGRRPAGRRSNTRTPPPGRRSDRRARTRGRC